MRKALAPSEKTSNAKAVDECESEEDEDKRLEKEMEELKGTALRKKKREKRLLAKRQAKVNAYALHISFQFLCWYPFFTRSSQCVT